MRREEKMRMKKGKKGRERSKGKGRKERDGNEMKGKEGKEETRGREGKEESIIMKAFHVSKTAIAIPLHPEVKMPLESEEGQTR